MAERDTIEVELREELLEWAKSKAEENGISLDEFIGQASRT